MPIQRRPSPLAIYQAGPPQALPQLSRILYNCARVLSAKAVAMPISAASHIQKMAPGPPRINAMATPIKLPQPIRAAREVHKAWNGEIPPPPRVPESLRIVKVWQK
ncbi:hypothetical protein SODG_007081 [Sodalis praecaptivus]